MLGMRRERSGDLSIKLIIAMGEEGPPQTTMPGVTLSVADDLVPENHNDPAGYYAMTLSEIGEEMGISRQAVHYLEQRALGKVKQALIEMGITGC